MSSSWPLVCNGYFESGNLFSIERVLANLDGSLTEKKKRFYSLQRTIARTYCTNRGKINAFQYFLLN